MYIAIILSCPSLMTRLYTYNIFYIYIACSITIWPCLYEYKLMSVYWQRIMHLTVNLMMFVEHGSLIVCYLVKFWVNKVHSVGPLMNFLNKSFPLETKHKIVEKNYVWKIFTCYIISTWNCKHKCILHTYMMNLFKNCGWANYDVLFLKKNVYPATVYHHFNIHTYIVN